MLACQSSGNKKNQNDVIKLLIDKADVVIDKKSNSLIKEKSHLHHFLE